MTFVASRTVADAEAASLADKAIEAMADGDFADALPPLRGAVQGGDVRPGTLLNLAIAEDRAGDRDRAHYLIRLVASLCPDWEEPPLRLAESLRSAGRHAEAEAEYRRALALNPDRAEAMVALGGLLLLRHAAAEARDLLLRCCGSHPANAEAWNTLGLAYSDCAQHRIAHAAFRRACDLQPDAIDCALNAVDAAVRTGAAEAESLHLTEWSRREPANAVPVVALGMLQDRIGLRSAAIECLEAAWAMAPGATPVLKLLAGLLARSPQAARAEAVLRQLTVRLPEDARAANDHAAVLMRVHRHAEARLILQRELERHGPHAAIMCNLANATACLGWQREAVQAARQAIALDPAQILPRRALCNTLPYEYGTTGAAMLEAMRACAATIPRSQRPDLDNDRSPDRPLVVGLLSGTLRSHPVGWMTVAGFENLDPAAFRLVCLVQNAAPHDPIARRYRAIAAEWIEVDHLNDERLAELARELRLDVLIELGGYGDASRMIACANRLAPVQVKWVGMQVHSSGLPEMDWFLTDRWETPPGFEAFYSERLLRLPDGYICYSPPTYAPPVTPLPALRNGFVTFGCFNNLAKMTPEVIEAWCEILRRVPRSRLILKTHQLSDAETADRFRGRFVEAGIPAERVEMRGSSGHRAFMGQYGDIDIVLDPFPYSGGLTTCEALWMGVPTITCPGELFASRHSASHLSNAGLADWVAPAVRDYIEMAVARSADLDALAALRADLRERVRRSPLCDAPRFGANLGAALRFAWQDWCARRATGAAPADPHDPCERSAPGARPTQE